MHTTTSTPYSKSFQRRLRVLFSPVRLSVLVAAIAFCVVLNVVYIGNGGSLEWIGLLSAIPLLAFAAWTIATDYSHRRREKTQTR